MEGQTLYAFRVYNRDKFPNAINPEYRYSTNAHFDQIKAGPGVEVVYCATPAEAQAQTSAPVTCSSGIRLIYTPHLFWEANNGTQH